jgi:hypothetical protein
MTTSMTKVEDTLSTQAKIVDPNTVFKPQDAVEDLAVSMLGARFASAIGPGGAGSLGFASRTMNMTRKFFSGMPARQRLLLLEETVKDPALFQQMMTRAITEEESRNLTSGILRRFYSPEVFPTALDRYVDTLATEEPPPEQQAPTRQGPSQSQQMLRTLPPAPPTRGMPNLAPAAPPAAQGQQGAPAPAPAPGPQGAAPQPPTQSRQMLSALFPEDRLLQGVQ